METLQKTSRVINCLLWVSQIVLAISLFWAAWMKLVQPIDTLAAMWSWTGQIPPMLVRASGIIDALGAAGLIFPAWLRIWPVLTPVAAGSIVGLMLCASVFHIMRGEASVIGLNIGFACLAAFVTWGRFRNSSIPIARTKTGAG